LSYEIRARSAGEILDTGWRLLRDHFAVLLGIGVVLYLPLAFLGTAFQEALDSGSSDAAGAAALVFLVMAVVSPIVAAAITHALAEVFLGREATVGGSLRFSLSILGPLVGTFLLYALAVAGGLVLFLVPGIYLMLAFMVVNQVVVIERVFGARALGRSRDLMGGNLLRGFGVMLVSVLIWSLLQFGAELALAGLPWIQPIGSALVQAAGFAYYSAVGVLLYVDLRCRKGGFDAEQLSRLVEA
jgi:hypothetical protein